MTNEQERKAEDWSDIQLSPWTPRDRGLSGWSVDRWAVTSFDESCATDCAAWLNRQEQSRETELTTLRERLAAAEALLSRSWLAKQSFWFYDEVCIHHPFFGSGWVAQRNPLLIGKNGTTGAEALRECEPRQFNGWGFDNPIDAYLAAVAAGWLKPQPQAETAEER